MRNLGQDEKGKSYIDYFRTIVTQIGNALGYVRMVRSGGLYYTSQDRNTWNKYFRKRSKTITRIRRNKH